MPELEVLPAVISQGTSQEVTGEKKGALHKIKRTAQVTVALAEITPLNEAMRLAAFGAGELYSHSPAMGALTFGLSTLAIEGSAAVATASLMNTETNRRVNDFLKEKLEKLGYTSDRQMTRYSKTVGAFLGGSVVGMALEQFDDPDRTVEQNRRFGLLTASWLAGVCAVGGAMGSEGIDLVAHNPVVSASLAGSVAVAAAGRKVKAALSRRHKVTELIAESQPSVWLDHDKHGFEYGLIRDASHLEKAATLEQQVWDEKDYGNLEVEGYGPHITISRTFAAFKGEDCIGMTRMFRANEEIVPPFLEDEMPYEDEAERQKFTDLAREGLVEELGTVAVAPEHRGKRVNLRLWRMAYRDARARGVKYWGIIMEPERVERMNKYQGFTFKQLGETIDYQGGECAAHIMNLEEVDESMRAKHPLNHYWFTKLSTRP